jgi:hypothetical protein
MESVSNGGAKHGRARPFIPETTQRPFIKLGHWGVYNENRSGEFNFGSYGFMKLPIHFLVSLKMVYHRRKAVRNRRHTFRQDLQINFHII